MRRYLIALSLLTLAACDKPAPPDIVQTQREALEKAKGIEQTLQQSEAERRAKIDAAENP